MKVLGVIAIFFGIACSGGDDGTPGGVDGNLLVTEVSEDDELALCEHFLQKYSDTRVKSNCYQEALDYSEAPAEDLAACEATFAECVNDPDRYDVTPTCDPLAEQPELLPACPELTVTEFSQCMSAAMDLMEDLVGESWCPTGRPEFPQLFDIPACASILEICPRPLSGRSN